MGWRAWEDLLRRREEAWNEAEVASEEAGNPYKDRHGNWRNTERRDLCSVALNRWCEQRGITYS